jgi:hypothetical protein
MAKVKGMFCHQLLWMADMTVVFIYPRTRWSNCPICLSKFEKECYRLTCLVPLGLHEMKNAEDNMMLQHTTSHHTFSLFMSLPSLSPFCSYPTMHT